MILAPSQTADPLAAHHQRRLADVRRQRRRALGLVLLSVPVGLLIPWFFVQLIGQAQSACLDLDGGGRFALFGLWFLLALVSGWAFLIGCLVAWNLRMAARTAVGLILVLAICVVTTRQSVPLGSPADYPAGTTGECGPGGVPTWWPAILPHQ